MLKSKQKIITIQQQLEFINETIHALEVNGCEEIRLKPNDKIIDLLNKISENLVFVKLLFELPYIHQAAIETMDAAFIVNTENEDFKDVENLMLSIRKDSHFSFEQEDEELHLATLQQIAANAVAGVGKFIINKSKTEKHGEKINYDAMRIIELLKSLLEPSKKEVNHG